MLAHLFLVPFKIWEEDKPNFRFWIFIDNLLSFCLFLQDVVDPLEGSERRRVNAQSQEGFTVPMQRRRHQGADLHAEALLLNVGQSDGLIVLSRLLHQETLLSLVFLYMLLCGRTHDCGLDLCETETHTHTLWDFGLNAPLSQFTSF